MRRKRNAVEYEAITTSPRPSPPLRGGEGDGDPRPHLPTGLNHIRVGADTGCEEAIQAICWIKYTHESTAKIEFYLPSFSLSLFDGGRMLTMHFLFSTWENRVGPRLGGRQNNLVKL